MLSIFLWPKVLKTVWTTIQILLKKQYIYKKYIVSLAQVF